MSILYRTDANICVLSQKCTNLVQNRLRMGTFNITQLDSNEMSKLCDQKWAYKFPKLEFQNGHFFLQIS